ncbi:MULTISPECIES: glycerophosphodiester phosphodiesterase family protein [Modestobacter]|uniref:glycerophosphodiester phosphodiesterase n=1 Tax=Modestobacter caceresii TaxID=1522368 RepID=A0A098Y6Q8_9ACTN|nr:MULTISPECIES: glycerophosphodiester phosphodiesterase family protein [Modestobacter]KGH46132.1 glycerophosphodiester phosphodiesterase [Modestobacter caceresii]
MQETGLKAVHSPRQERSPRIIGHRGAPSYRPEHTVASYELAIDLGADLIEPDVVVTRDGQLVARHENELSRSTDVAQHPEFADRRRTQEVDGEELTGWFSEDFTLAELRTLRAVERLPGMRPMNTAYDGRFGILTLAEVVEVVRRRSTPGREVRVQAELKCPAWFAAQGLPMTELVAAELRRLDATRSDGSVVVMAFEQSALRELRADLGSDGPRLVQLIEEEGRQDALVTPSGLREVSTYADGIAPHKGRILLHGADGGLVGVSDLITQAHRAGLTVEPWTLRPENVFLPSHLRRGGDPRGLGDAQTEARLLFALGVDSVITDAPETAHRARAELSAAAMAPVRPRV